MKSITNCHFQKPFCKRTIRVLLDFPNLLKRFPLLNIDTMVYSFCWLIAKILTWTESCENWTFIFRPLSWKMYPQAKTKSKWRQKSWFFPFALLSFYIDCAKLHFSNIFGGSRLKTLLHSEISWSWSITIFGKVVIKFRASVLRLADQSYLFS